MPVSRVPSSPSSSRAASPDPSPAASPSGAALRRSNATRTRPAALAERDPSSTSIAAASTPRTRSPLNVAAHASPPPAYQAAVGTSPQAPSNEAKSSDKKLAPNPKAAAATPGAPPGYAETANLPNTAEARTAQLLQVMQSGSPGDSHRLLGDYLKNFTFEPEFFKSYRGQQRELLHGIAAHGDVGHVDQLLGEKRAPVDLSTRASGFLSQVMAKNPDGTRMAMVERLLAHPSIGGDAAGLAEPLKQAAQRGLMAETALLLRKNAKQRTEAKAAALEAGHPEVALMIQKHIDAQPRNRIRNFFGGLGG